MEEGEEKDSFTYYIANMMKKNFLLYNRETVDDELIHKHLEELSNGELKIRDEYQLKSSGSLVGKKPNPIIKKKKKKKINFRPKQ
jgi:predicted solute-binding protein